MWGVELFISTLAQPEELGVDQSNLLTIIAGAIKKDKQEMAYLKCVMVATVNNWAGIGECAAQGKNVGWGRQEGFSPDAHETVANANQR